MTSDSDKLLQALNLAKQFHDTYELLAPEHGYATREDTKEFDPESPNGRLMVATCHAMLEVVIPRSTDDGWIAHRDKLLSLLQAVGHVGVDFGEGEYQLGREDIELAQHLYADLSPPENNHE